MAKDIQGTGLSLASKFAGSKWANKLGLRKPAEKLAYTSTKAGFKFIGKLTQKKQAKNSDASVSKNSREKKIFDLSLTDEQEMIKDTVRSYASEEIGRASCRERV